MGLSPVKIMKLLQKKLIMHHITSLKHEDYNMFELKFAVNSVGVVNFEGLSSKNHDNYIACIKIVGDQFRAVVPSFLTHICPFQS